MTHREARHGRPMNESRRSTVVAPTKRPFSRNRHFYMAFSLVRNGSLRPARYRRDSLLRPRLERFLYTTMTDTARVPHPSTADHVADHLLCPLFSSGIYNASRIHLSLW